MAGKIKAMADARQSEDTLIVARTDAIAVEGLQAAIDRAGVFAEAGADVLFIEAPRSEEEMRQITRTFGDRLPLLANMVEGGATPIQTANDLETIGFSIVIFPGGIVRALAKTAGEYYARLKTHGSNRPFAERMHDFDGLKVACPAGPQRVGGAGGVGFAGGGDPPGSDVLELGRVVHAHADEGRDVEAERAGVDHRVVSRNDSSSFQLFDALHDRRRAEAYLGCDRLQRGLGVSLKRMHDLTIDGIEFKAVFAKFH